MEKVNVNGGAIAIGHPLGATGHYLHKLCLPNNMQHVLHANRASLCSGARCVATLLHEMKRRGKDCRFGVISMCIGIYEIVFSRLNRFNGLPMLMVSVKCECNRHWNGSCSCF